MGDLFPDTARCHEAVTKVPSSWVAEQGRGSRRSRPLVRLGTWGAGLSPRVGGVPLPLRRGSLTSWNPLFMFQKQVSSSKKFKSHHRKARSFSSFKQSG